MAAAEAARKGQTNMKRTPNGISYNLRNLIYERDSYTCVLCERMAQECHHVVHKSFGGRDTLSNLVAVCRHCHLVLHGVHGVYADWVGAKERVREYVMAAGDGGGDKFVLNH